MKKSLVIISLSLILLVILSFVFASGFNGKKTGSTTLPETQPIDEGKSSFFGGILKFFGGNKISDPPSPLPAPLPVPEDKEIPTNGNLGGESCEVFEIEELYIRPGDVGEDWGILNNRYVDFYDNEVLTIDETFSYPLKEGNKYYIAIPSQECYWEASYEEGELHLVTVCLTSE